MTRTFILSAIAFCAIGATAHAGADFATVDANSDGFVSEAEFVTWKTSTGDMSAADALLKFIEIDADASGMISESEMKAAQEMNKGDDDDSTDSTEM